MSEWAAITYREFWDVPRAFIVREADRVLLFEALFDEALDEYRLEYEVFVMPALSESDIKAPWKDIRKHAISRLGSIPVSDVRFDRTLRREVDLESIRSIH